MSKELKALKRMAEYRFEERGVERDDGTDFEIIENGLKRLEAIDDAKISEALECLKKVRETYYTEELSYEDDEIVRKNLNIIEQALLKLDFLEDAMDLPTNCFCTFKNRNGDEVTVMRREKYEKYEKYDTMMKYLTVDEIKSTSECATLTFKIEVNKYYNTKEGAYIYTNEKDFNILFELAQKLMAGGE